MMMMTVRDERHLLKMADLLHKLGVLVGDGAYHTAFEHVFDLFDKWGVHENYN